MAPFGQSPFGRSRILVGIVLLIILLGCPLLLFHNVCYSPFQFPTHELLESLPPICGLVGIIQIVLVTFVVMLSILGVVATFCELVGYIWKSFIQRGVTQELSRKGDENV